MSVKLEDIVKVCLKHLDGHIKEMGSNDHFIIDRNCYKCELNRVGITNVEKVQEIS